MSMAATQAARALENLRHAIKVTREAADKAERELAHMVSTGHGAQVVLHALAWGHVHSLTYVESAMGAIEDMHTIRSLEARDATPTAAWFIVTRSGEAMNPQHGEPTDNDRAAAKRDGSRIILLGSKGGAS